MLREKPGREERERRFADAVEAYENGRLTLTEARIAAGIAPRPARLAYRFPGLFGHLCRLSAADRTDPVYAPSGGWLSSNGKRAEDGGVPDVRLRR